MMAMMVGRGAEVGETGERDTEFVGCGGKGEGYGVRDPAVVDLPWVRRRCTVHGWNRLGVEEVWWGADDG